MMAVMVMAVMVMVMAVMLMTVIVMVMAVRKVIEVDVHGWERLALH